MRLCVVKDLTEHDIVQRIMPKDNYLIAMLNVGVLSLTVPGVPFRPLLHADARVGLLGPSSSRPVTFRLPAAPGCRRPGGRSSTPSPGALPPPPPDTPTGNGASTPSTGGQVVAAAFMRPGGMAPPPAPPPLSSRDGPLDHTQGW